MGLAGRPLCSTKSRTPTSGEVTSWVLINLRCSKKHHVSSRARAGQPAGQGVRRLYGGKPSGIQKAETVPMAGAFLQALQGTERAKGLLQFTARPGSSVGRAED